MTASSLPPSLRVDAQTFFAVDTVKRIKPELDIQLSDRAYLPRIDDLQADWVATVAAPAFALLHRNRGAGASKSFCSIGTGSGMDALAGIEFFEANQVGITDLFAEVVDTAAANVRANIRPGLDVALHAGHGDLLEPLRADGIKFDVIYENLPNLPLAKTARLDVDRTSSSYVPEREEQVPDVIADHLLTLHYLALRQAREFLNPGGTVLSTLGGRIPLRVITDMSRQAGYTPRILTYTWKIQVDPEDNLKSYALWQEQGLGPFTFYRAEVLAEAFAGRDRAAAGEQAEALEHSLLPHRLDAAAALDVLAQGGRIAHTVAVLQSDI